MSRSGLVLLVFFIGAGATWDLSPSQHRASILSEVSSLQSSFNQERHRRSTQNATMLRQTDRLSDLSLAARSLTTPMNWTLPQYYSATSAVAVGTFIYYINRSPDGIMISEFDTIIGAWTKVELIPLMTDSEGWDVEMRYSTIRSEVVGSCIYIYGRGATSSLLIQYNIQTSDWEVQSPFAYLTDAAGFTLPQYYKTVRMVALGTSLYILARDSLFFYLAAFDTCTQVWSMLPTLNSASEFWSQEKYYATIRVAAEPSRLWVFARVPSGINLVAFDVDMGTWSSIYSNSAFSDAAGDDKPAYYCTAQFVSLNGYLYMSLRRNFGEFMVHFDTSSLVFSSVPSHEYPDEAKWNLPKNYMTMQMHVCGGKPVIGGRANDCYVTCSFIHPSSWANVVYVPGFEASQGWEKVEAYMSVQQVCAGNRLYIVGRKDVSLAMSSQDVLATTVRKEPPLAYNCHSTCATCVAASSTSCLHCLPGAHLTGTAPAACACDSSFFPTPDAGNCVKCGQGCVLCGGVSPNCSQCLPNAHLISSLECGCDAGYFFSGGISAWRHSLRLSQRAEGVRRSQVCTRCHASCLACKDATATGCVGCWPFAILQSDGSCKCGDSFFLDSGQCQVCDSACYTCISGASTGCLSCFAGAQLQGAAPSSCACAAGYYPSPTVASCLPCSPRCLRCSSASGCQQCTANAVPSDCACVDGYYASATACVKCSEGCERCQSTGCLQCSASWVVWGNGCVEAIPSPELSYRGDFTLQLLFTKAIARELQPADIALRVIDFNGVEFAVTWEMAVMETLRSYTIRLFFDEMPTTRSIAEVDFANPYSIGVAVGHLSTFIPAFDLPSNETQLQPSLAAAVVGQSAIVITVMLSICSSSPATIFSLFNLLQVVSYIPLMQWKVSSELKSTLIALKLNSFVYNPLTLVFNDAKGVPLPFAEDFYSSGLFLLNSSLPVCLLIGTLSILLTLGLLARLPPTSAIATFCRSQLQRFKWNTVLLHLWILLYLDLGVSSLVQLVSSLSFSPGDAINLVIAVLILALFVMTPALYFFFLVINNTPYASRQIKAFKENWGGLFMKFWESSGLHTSAYYLLFLVHRALYAMALVLLPTHPHLQRILALAPSACIFITQTYVLLRYEHSHGHIHAAELALNEGSASNLNIFELHGHIHAAGSALSEGTAFMILCVCAGAEFLPPSHQDTVTLAGEVLVFAGIAGVTIISFAVKRASTLDVSRRAIAAQSNLAGSSRA